MPTFSGVLRRHHEALVLIGRHGPGHGDGLRSDDAADAAILDTSPFFNADAVVDSEPAAFDHDTPNLIIGQPGNDAVAVEHGSGDAFLG